MNSIENLESAGIKKIDSNNSVAMDLEESAKY